MFLIFLFDLLTRDFYCNTRLKSCRVLQPNLLHDEFSFAHDWNVFWMVFHNTIVCNYEYNNPDKIVYCSEFLYKNTSIVSFEVCQVIEMRYFHSRQFETKSMKFVMASTLTDWWFITNSHSVENHIKLISFINKKNFHWSDCNLIKIEVQCRKCIAIIRHLFVKRRENLS